MAFTKILMYCCTVLAAVYLTSVAGDPEEREWFNLLPSVIPCNYTEQSGSTCLSCSESLFCFSNNVGLRWQCTGLTPNCNNGHCSISTSENCTSSS